MNMTNMASLVVPTRNRVGELRQLLLSAVSQTVSLEIHIMDDGDDSETREMLTREFPLAYYHNLGTNCGPAFQRNRGIELASCNIVFPLDDDTAFPSPNTVEQTIADFDHPRVGAVGIPFINVRQDVVLRQGAPSCSGIFAVHAFVGAAHAVRRDLFLKLGGYREHFFYMGEEGDLCIRLMRKGYVVRLGNSDPVYHFESPKRNTSFAGFCGRRNDVLFAWHNVPTVFLPLHLAMTTMKGLYWSVTGNHPVSMLKGIFSGFASAWEHRRGRAPVSAAIYRLQRRLKKKGPLELESLEPHLPSIRKSSEREDLLASNGGPKSTGIK